MEIIKEEEFKKLKIKIEEYFSWIEEAFTLKSNCILPVKVSLKPEEAKLFNIMPIVIKKLNIMGVKIVTRIPNVNPLIKSKIFIYNYLSGDLDKIIEGNFITTLRTGMLAAYSIIKLINILPEYEIGIIGLGNVSKMTFDIIFKLLKNKKLKVKLYIYKEQHIEFAKRYSDYKNISFEYIHDYEGIIKNSDLIVSGVSYMNDYFGEIEWFKKGVLVVPIHTKGFQNLDTSFDKIIVDDKEHVKNFKYYKKFKECLEIEDVIKNNMIRRSKDRILVYNVGISLLDIYFAIKLLSYIGNEGKNEDNGKDI